MSSQTIERFVKIYGAMRKKRWFQVVDAVLEITVAFMVMVGSGLFLILEG